MFRVAMELGAEELNEKLNLNSQTKLTESPIGSEKLEQSRSDVTEDEEMLTAESEEEQMENGVTDIGPGGDNKPTKTSKVNDNVEPSVGPVNPALDITNTVRTNVIFGLDGHCLDGPVIAGILKQGQGAEANMWEGTFEVCIPKIIVEGAEEDTKQTDQVVGVSDDSKVNLLEGSNDDDDDDDGSDTPKNASDVNIDENDDDRKNQEEADVILKHSVQQVIDDPIYSVLKKMELELAKGTEDTVPEKNEIEAAAPLQTEESEGGISSEDDMEIETESHGKVLEDNRKVKVVKSQNVMTRPSEPHLELIPEIDEFEESRVESVEIVKCESEMGRPEPEEKSQEPEEAEQPDQADGESSVDSCREPGSGGKLEEEELENTKNEEVESRETNEREVVGDDEKGTEEVNMVEREQMEASEVGETDVVEEVSETDQEEKSEGHASEKAEKMEGMGKEKESSGEGEERQDDAKQKDEDNMYLRPQGRSFPFKLKVSGVPLSTIQDAIMKYFGQCGDVLKVWRENKRRIHVVMADEVGYRKALSLRKPRIGTSDILIQSVSESMAVVTGIPPDMDPEEVEEKLMNLIESIGVCVCRVVAPRTEPKTEDNPNPLLQGHAYVYFPDVHSLEKVRGTLRLELGDKELGMFANRSIFEELFCVHVSPLRGELPRSVLDKKLHEALAPAGRIATVNLVQTKRSEGLSANVIFGTQQAARKATNLKGVEICGKPVTIVPFQQSRHGQRDRQQWVRVTNMPKDVTEEEVKKHFAIAGEPKEIMMDENQGICMMIMESEAAVQKCLSLHQSYMRSDCIVVLLSDPFGGRKSNRGGFRRQGGRGRGRVAGGGNIPQGN